MNSNLTPSFNHKDLLLKKLYYSVICSVLSQLVLLQTYVFVSSFSVLHPIEWILDAVTTFTSVNTWLFTIPFLTIIFAQSIVCGKDYVFKSSYCSTRFQKLLSAFSLHNLVLLILHVLAGPMLIWLFLSLGGGQFQNLTNIKENKTHVLNEGSFYLVLSGLWTGLFYFIKVYMTEKHLAFPVIHQRKWLQFQTNVFPLFKNSFILTVWPTIGFIILYALLGSLCCNTVSSIFGIEVEKMNGIFVYFHLWCFSAIYYFNMNLMKFFFNLFLTEQVEFPLCKASDTLLNLQDSLIMSDLPIIQNLACLDLCTLAQWSKYRRQMFYTLSQPGGHPHNWNMLVENVLKLFNEYIVLLDKRIEDKEIKPAVTPLSPPPIVSPLQSPDKFRNISTLQSPDKFRNLRNMSVLSDPVLADVVSVTQTNMPKFELPEVVMTAMHKKIDCVVTFLKVVLGIDFLFGELPQANIQKCLANGLIIIWTSQGISDLTCAAMTEDRYGIVQKDIPALVTALVQLKQNLDKLSKLSSLTKKVAGQDDFNYKMKVAVISAVQRSLFNICITYKEYLNDLPLKRDVKIYLQSICKS